MFIFLIGFTNRVSSFFGGEFCYLKVKGNAAHPYICIERCPCTSIIHADRQQNINRPCSEDNDGTRVVFKLENVFSQPTCTWDMVVTLSLYNYTGKKFDDCFIILVNHQHISIAAMHKHVYMYLYILCIEQLLILYINTLLPLYTNFQDYSITKYIFANWLLKQCAHMPKTPVYD